MSHASPPSASTESWRPSWGWELIAAVQPTPVSDLSTVDPAPSRRSSVVVHGHEVFGVDVDTHTGCAHYRGEFDIIAIKFKCCREYYPCYACHAAIADHAVAVWPVSAFDERGVLCGACGVDLTIREYLHGGNVCPACQARFNPACKAHDHLYFDV